MKNKNKVLAVILGIFVVSTMISQSLMDAFSVIVCIFLLWDYYKVRRENLLDKTETNKLSPYFKLGIEGLWIFWVAVIIAGFAFTPTPAEAPSLYWLKRIIEFKWILIIYFLIPSYKRTGVTLRATQYDLYGFLGMCLYSLLKYAWEMYHGTNEEGNRLGGIYDFSMTYAHLYGQYVCATLGVLLGAWSVFSTRKKILWLSIFVISFGTVLMTLTRGIWIALLASILVMAFLKKPRHGFVALLVMAIFSLGLYATVPAIKDRIEFTKNFSKSYDMERLVLWKTNWLIFLDHPLVGVGYGQNKMLLRSYYDLQGLPKDQYVGHAHNEYMHLLGGTGALGLLCYLSVLIFFYWQTLQGYLRAVKNNWSWYQGLALGALGAQTLFIVGGLTESNFEHAKVRLVVMIFWSLGWWLNHEVQA